MSEMAQLETGDVLFERFDKVRTSKVDLAA